MGRWFQSYFSSGGWIRTNDLRVMSLNLKLPTLVRRVTRFKVTWRSRVQGNPANSDLCLDYM
jgi:hypothetical protein